MTDHALKMTDHACNVTDHALKMTDHARNATDHALKMTDHACNATDHALKMTDHAAAATDHHSDTEAQRRTRTQHPRKLRHNPSLLSVPSVLSVLKMPFIPRDAFKPHTRTAENTRSHGEQSPQASELSACNVHGALWHSGTPALWHISRRRPMGIFPPSRLGKVEFYENRITDWAANAAGIGVTPAAIADLQTLVEAARAAYGESEKARIASQAATQDFYDAVRAMHNGPGAGSDIVDQIRGFARRTDNPQVYVLAQIPAPQPASSIPPPGTPFAFSVGLLETGALELKWKCINPEGAGGTIYEVRRRSGVNPATPFVYVGGSGTRSFTDNSLPGGSSPVTYQVTAARSTVRGNPGQFTVAFGVGGGPGFAITQETDANGNFIRKQAA